ncbi:DNA internalization-related competence protein ComEC/Rec2 [soil metagenome]
MPRLGWLAAGAIAGALLGVQAGPGHGVLLAALGAACAAGSGLVLRRPPLVLVSVGALVILLRVVAAGPPPETRASVDVFAPSHQAKVVTTYAPSGGSQRAVLELVPAAGTAPGATGPRVYATLPRYPVIAPPDAVKFAGRLEPAPQAEESGFGEFLARSRISFTVRSRSLSLLVTADTPAAGLEQLRRGAGDSLARALPEPQAGLAAAIVVGLRDRLARDVTADFRTAGLSHVVAISGFHMALVAALAGAVLRPLPRRPRSVGLLVLLVGYALLAGASPSVLRAAAMAGTVLLLRVAGRRSQAAAALGMAVLVLLAIEPATVSEAGFQLSVAATAGLLRWATPFGEWLAARLPFVPRWLVETLGVSLAAQLATLPLVLLHFGRLSLVAPLSNLLAAPLIAPAMASAGVNVATGGLTAAGLPEVLVAPFELAGALMIGALISVAQLCAALPLAAVELPPPFDLAGAAAAAGLVALALRRSRPGVASASPEANLAALPKLRATQSGRQRRLLAGAAVSACLVLIVAVIVGARPDGRLHMTVLDIGQGDAILLVGPAGSRLLVDTGPDPDLLIAQLDARLPAWDRRLDLVVITHPHEDHVAGLALLLDRYRIGQIAEPGMIGLGPGDAAFRRRLAELGRTTRILAAGDTFDFDGARIAVHWPLAGQVPTRPSDGGKQVNNVSLVLELAFGERRLLMTGDIEEEIDGRLLSLGLGADGAAPVDVLKVAHHGSATASTDAFLEQVRPSLAVISAGTGNPYGHPSPGTVGRLERAGAQVLRTDRDGSVEISTDGRDLRVWRSGGRAAADPPPIELGGIGFCPIPGPASVSWRAAAYNRADGSALAPAGGAPLARPRAARLAAAPLRGRGRDRLVPGRPNRARRWPARSRACRSGCAAA